jgi:hypothetical protein
MAVLFSVKKTDAGGLRGYNAGKVKGRWRHVFIIERGFAHSAHGLSSRRHGSRRLSSMTRVIGFST